jgi:DNA-binding ferritin-like protein (Dps family)
MRIQAIIESKREWRTHMARVKALPQDYQIVYKEIQKYLFKVGPVELTEGTGLLSGIVDLFEEGVVSGKGVLEMTGSDVAAFCDGLVKDSNTYTDIVQESVGQEVSKAMKKFTDKMK